MRTAIIAGGTAAVLVAGVVYAQLTSKGLRIKQGTATKGYVDTLKCSTNLTCTVAGGTATVVAASSSGTGTPGGVANDIQINNGLGAFGAYAGTSCAYAVKTLNSAGTATCTVAPTIPADISGASFITKVAEASLSNEFALASLGSGVLLNTTVTGVPTIYAGTACSANQYMTALDSSAVKTCSQVGTSQLSGTITDAQLANNYSGIGACAAGRFASTLNDNASPTCTQVAYADVSGTPAIPSQFYDRVQEEGSNLTQRSTVNFIGPAVTAADDGAGTKTKVTVVASGIGACAASTWASTLNDGAAPTCTQPAYTDVSGTPTIRYQTVQDEGSNLTQRNTVNFIGAGVSCADNGGTSVTDCTIAGGSGSPGAPDGGLQYNNNGAFGGVTYWLSDGGTITGLDQASNIVAPTAGASYYVNKRGIPTPHVIPEASPAWTAPPGMESDWQVGCWSGVPGSNTINTDGAIIAPTAVGTLTARTPTDGTVGANMRSTDLTSAATAGSSSELRSTIAFAYRGSATGLGGFIFYTRVETTTVVAQQRAFFGLSTTTAALANANPSTLFNNVYIGYDAAQTTLRACGNDAAGAATCADLGANFPVSNSAVYDIWLYSKQGTGGVFYHVERLETVFTASGSITVSGDLPGVTIFLGPHLWVNNGTTAQAVNLRFAKMCLSSRW